MGNTVHGKSFTLGKTCEAEMDLNSSSKTEMTVSLKDGKGTAIIPAESKRRILGPGTTATSQKPYLGVVVHAYNFSYLGG